MDYQTKQIVFFDGVCNVCNRFVSFLLKHDTNSRFYFASLDSAAAADILKLPEGIDSVVFYDKGKITVKSMAVFEILKYLNWPWKALLIFKILPVSWTDKMYDFIARNRYKWFGKRESCMIPTPEIKDRFL